MLPVPSMHIMLMSIRHQRIWLSPKATCLVMNAIPSADACNEYHNFCCCFQLLCLQHILDNSRQKPYKMSEDIWTWININSWPVAIAMIVTAIKDHKHMQAVSSIFCATWGKTFALLIYSMFWKWIRECPIPDNWKHLSGIWCVAIP